MKKAISLFALVSLPLLSGCETLVFNQKTGSSLISSNLESNRHESVTEYKPYRKGAGIFSNGPISSSSRSMDIIDGRRVYTLKESTSYNGKSTETSSQTTDCPFVKRIDRTKVIDTRNY